MFTHSAETKSSVKCHLLTWWVDETQMLDGLGGAGSVPCRAQHQLRRAVLTHVICQHGGKFLPCNQKHGRDSSRCQLSPKSNAASSSGVGVSTDQQPQLLMTPGPSRDLRFVSNTPVYEALYLWQLLLHCWSCGCILPWPSWFGLGGWQWADVAGSYAGEMKELRQSEWWGHGELREKGKNWH